MSTYQKTYRYRLKPTSEQEECFRRYAGARRYVYNWALARRKAHYEATGKTLSVTELCAELTVMKRQPATAWLREMNAQSLQQAIRDLDRAFHAFFARRAKYPRFRSKKRERPSFRIPQSVSLMGDRLIVPKVGPVKLVLHRPLEGTLKSATFKQDATGAWYVTLVVHFELSDTPLTPPRPDHTVGVDVGLKDLAVLSDGSRIPAPKNYRCAERKLRRLQRHLSRCQRNSKNREKARIKVARQHQRVANKRHDFLHKLTSSLVLQHDAICIEDLAVSGLGKTNLSKGVYDAGWGLLRFFLTYKACWQRKHLSVIGRFYPSSRLCPNCGVISRTLSLADRIWICDCGATHDRDLNAARNIRDQGLRLLLAVGTTDTENASRAPVSPTTGRHGATTEEALPLAAG